MSRQKNSMNNLIWGIIGNVITSLVAIMIPRLFIVNYGSEVNGLLSSIRQIYVYLARCCAVFTVCSSCGVAS